MRFTSLSAGIAAALACIAAVPASALTYVSTTGTGGNRATPVEVTGSQASVDYSLFAFSPLTTTFQVQAGDAASYNFDSSVDIFTGVGAPAAGVVRLVLGLTGGATFTTGTVAPAFSRATTALNAAGDTLTISFSPAETTNVTLGSLASTIGDFGIQRNALAAGQRFSLIVSPFATAAAVPEPAAWAAMLVGVGVIGGTLRGRRRRTIAAA